MVAGVSKPEQILGERRGLALLNTTEAGPELSFASYRYAGRYGRAAALGVA
jgi:hypothetical protein